MSFNTEEGDRPADQRRGEVKEHEGPLVFTAERLARFKHLVAKYERPQSALLPTLYLAQEQWGYLTPGVMTYVSSLVDLPPASVFEAVTFYSMFRKKDMGKVCLQVCNNITCTMMGSERVLEIIREELGLRPGQVSPDGDFSCLTVECLGSCGTAPVVQVNDDYFENMEPETFRALLRRWKSGEAPVSTQPLN